MCGGSPPAGGNMIRRKKRRGLRLVFAGMAALAWALGSAFSPQPRTIHVPAQLLAQSLKDIAHQTGSNILFTPDAVQVSDDVPHVFFRGHHLYVHDRFKDYRLLLLMGR